MKMLDLFNSARSVSVPILVIRTADQMATADVIRKAVAEFPVVRWDAAMGITPTADLQGKPYPLGVQALTAAKIAPDDTIGFADAMVAAKRLPPKSVLLVFNAQRQLQAQEPLAIAQNVQALVNLRDDYKRNFRMVVLLGPAVTVPSEMEQDVVIINHELPTRDELKVIVNDMHKAGGLQPPSDDVLTKAVDAVSGLSAFAAEQVVAMSLLPEIGVDIDALWERKRVTIEQTKGLTVWRGRERFADLIGLEALKTNLRLRMAGKRPIGVVVWIDEIDKALANVEQDTSGVRMYQLLKLLTTMENNEWPGFVGVGLPGGGKSLIAKAFGNEAGVPTIALDFGATESKFVGESEENLIRVIQVIEAVGQGNAYFIATSNNATVMRPELQRRFTDGMWMFDLMSDAERDAAWKYYIHKYELPEQKRPKDMAWTGAEIRNCCRFAHETGATLIQAAGMIIPMAQSRAQDVEQLRRYANGRFLDANKGGWYQYTEQPMEQVVRAIALPSPVIDALQNQKES